MQVRRFEIYTWNRKGENLCPVLSTTKRVGDAMNGSKVKLGVGFALVTVAALGIGAGWPLVPSTTVEAGDKESRPKVFLPPPPGGLEPGSEPALVIRRPRGTFKREIPGFG